MATAKYVGPFEAVDVVDNDVLVTVERGESAEFSDAAAQGMVGQDIWELEDMPESPEPTESEGDE